jgi:uncharacterized protein (TIGR02246 family)
MRAAALAAPLVMLAVADAATAEDEIRGALEKWRAAFNERDEARVCDIFAADVVANYQGAPERDFASLCQLLQNAVQDPDSEYHYSLSIDEIHVFGDTAVVRLVWTLQSRQGGAAPTTVKETAVDIFRRQTDGGWKISRYLAYPASP